jgi:hypothetical protein
VGDNLSGRFKGNKMRDWPGARSAAEWAVFKIGMSARLVMMMGWHHPHGGRRGAQLQQEWRAACRHKTDWDVSPKQQSYQQYAGE